MESRLKHTLELGAKCVEIVILRGEGDLCKSQVTAQASASCSNVSATYSDVSATCSDISASYRDTSASYNDGSASLALPQQEPQDSGGRGAIAKEDLTKKVHLEE